MRWQAGDLVSDGRSKTAAWIIETVAPDAASIRVVNEVHRPGDLLFTYPKLDRPMEWFFKTIRPAHSRFWIMMYGESSILLEAIEEGKVADLGQERLSA